MKKTLTFLLTFLLADICYAQLDQKVISAQSGFWDDPSTWRNGVVPTYDPNNRVEARINNGHTVTVRDSSSTQDLVLTNDATVVIEAGADLLVNNQLLTGTNAVLENNGRFSSESVGVGNGRSLAITGSGGTAIAGDIVVGSSSASSNGTALDFAGTGNLTVGGDVSVGQVATFQATAGGKIEISGNVSLASEGRLIASDGINAIGSEIVIRGNAINEGTFRSDSLSRIILLGELSGTGNTGGADLLQLLSLSVQGDTVLSGDLSYYDFTIPRDITVTSTNGTLTIYGNVVDNGTFISNTGTVNFAGNSTRVFGDSTFSLYRVNVLSGSTVNLETQTTINEYLTVAGVVNSDSTLVLRSTPDLTASLIQEDGSEVNGVITVQRAISGGRFGHYVGSPVEGETFRDFLLEGGRAFKFGPRQRFPSGVWQVASGIMAPGIGYNALETNTRVQNYFGVPTNGDVTIPLYYPDEQTLENISDVDDIFYNLIANPYPSALDWNEVDKTNIDGSGAIYLFDADQRNYITSVSDTIPSGQAFFVKVSAARDLVFTNDMRVRNDIESNSDFARKKRDEFDLVKLKVSEDSVASRYDLIQLAFKNGASEAFISAEDAVKFGSNATGPTAYTKADNQNIAINFLPYPEADTVTVPLFVKAKHSGIHRLSTLSEEIFATSFPKYTVQFWNSITQEVHPVNESLPVELTAGETDSTYHLQFARIQAESGEEPDSVKNEANEYDIVTGPNFEEEKQSEFTFSVSGQRINFQLPEPAAKPVFNYQFIDAFGRKVIKANRRLENTVQGSIPITGLPEGLYILNIQSGNQFHTRRFIRSE